MEKFKVDVARVGEIEMPFLKFGSGTENFVILPGVSLKPVTDTAEAVAAAYAPLAEDHTVYLLDRRSTVPAGATVRDLAEDTATVLRALGVETADFFGASQGGMMALCLALDHPKTVHSIVLGSAACRLNDPFARLIDEWRALAQERNETALANAFADAIYAPATLKVARDAIVRSLKGASAQDYARFIAQLDACRGFSAEKDLGGISCPCLVLAAAGDRIFGLEEAERIVRKTNAAHFYYGTEYGHAVYDEAPDYLAKIRAFLKSSD